MWKRLGTIAAICTVIQLGLIFVGQLVCGKVLPVPVLSALAWGIWAGVCFYKAKQEGEC